MTQLCAQVLNTFKMIVADSGLSKSYGAFGRSIFRYEVTKTVPAIIRLDGTIIIYMLHTK